MTDAPDLIRVFSDTGTWVDGDWIVSLEENEPGIEYIRADLYEEPWQPIATAPKNVVVMVGWVGSDSLSLAECGDDGWRTDEATPIVDAPTHWMQPPSPPLP